jgi:peptidoglycan lytic transglycosylase
MLVVLALGACARPRVGPSSVPVGWEETGTASWYGYPHHGRRTASGEVYDMRQMTAAHRTLPFGTLVAVENLDTSRTVEVRINDRGPFVDSRIIDLSYGAARLLGSTGLMRVRLRVVATGASAPASPDRAYTVQLGAFVSADRASGLQRELTRAGTEATVQTAEIAGRKVYRVRVGHFRQREDATRRARRLSELGYPALVTEE